MIKKLVRYFTELIDNIYPYKSTERLNNKVTHTIFKNDLKI